MDKVKGLMRNLKLSAAEQRGIQLGGKDGSSGMGSEMQALGKVMSERPMNAVGLSESLGRAWCPLKWVRCKAMGANVVLFTFVQESGKRKALFEGPWMANNDLIVMVDFDPSKSLEDYVFDTIPIWIRVMKLPLGWMNRDTGLEIGDMVGESVDVEVGEDSNAVGEFLKMKARINITKPLMRGFMLNVGENKPPKWCPFEYEYLPELCYTCGLLGHDDKSCSIKLSKGETRKATIWRLA
ncbi:hypothetical protein ACQ4PT_059197 [Festuca glaucescens]